MIFIFLYTLIAFYEAVKSGDIQIINFILLAIPVSFFFINQIKNKRKTMRYVESLEGKIASISVIECDCGYHLGVDSSYISQVGHIITPCPACSKMINTYKIAECYEEGDEYPEEPEIEYTLNDKKCRVKKREDGLFLSFEGYEDTSTEDFAELINIYPNENELFVYIWSDKEFEDPTHIISLEKAKK